MTGAKRLRVDSSASKEDDAEHASEYEVEDESKKKRKKAFNRNKTDVTIDDPPNKVMRHIVKKLHKEQMTKEAAFVSRLAEMEKLLKEKEEYQRQTEMRAQKQMEKALDEKNNELEQQLRHQKKKLEKVLKKKEMEQKLLECQLTEIKKESAIAKYQAQKAKEDAKSSFINLMEMELQCTICNELFVQATSLNCAHVFCKLCINQWMKVKKDCPNCRTAITSQTQAVALDNYMDKMVERLSDKMKQQRANLIEQRKIEQDKFDRSVAGPSCLPVASAAVVAESARASRRSRNRTAVARLAAASMRVTSDTDLTEL